MLIKSIVDRAIIPSIERSDKLKRLLYYISEKVDLYGYGDYKKVFIKNGAKSAYGENIRRQIVERFEEIDRCVTISTSKTAGLFLAEALLSVAVNGGEVVECGCYAGGSTAKLSIVSKVTGRALRVFDSFAGLPNANPNDKRDYNVRESQAWMSEWTEGIMPARCRPFKEMSKGMGSHRCVDIMPGGLTRLSHAKTFRRA